MEPRLAEEMLIETGIDPRFSPHARFSFLQACKQGPPTLVRAFLVCGMPIGSRTDHEPPIIKAAESGRLELVELLVEFGASLQTVDTIGDTVVHTAANWGHADLVQDLHRLGAAVDVVNKGNWTPLSRAVNKGRVEIVEVLLDCGANPNLGVAQGAAPLAFAKDLAMLQRLLDAGADADIVNCDVTGDTLLLQKTSRQLEGEVRALVAHGAKDRPNRAGWTAAMQARDPEQPNDTIAGIVEGCEALSPAAGPTPTGDSRLSAAASRGDLGLVKSYLDAGHPCDAPNRYGSTALLTSCLQRHWEVARWLLEAGADVSRVNAYTSSALTSAAQAGELDMVERLLAAGAPANEGIPWGEEEPCSIALVLAAGAGHLEVVERLLKAGARLDSTISSGKTALCASAMQGHAEVLRHLLTAGANPGEGESPLLLAQARRRVECVEILAAQGAALDRRDASGMTALHRACNGTLSTKAEQVEIVRILCDAGADHMLLTDCHESPYDLALRNPNERVRTAMEAHLATGFLAAHSDGKKVDWAAAASAATREHLLALIEREGAQEIASLIDHGLDLSLLAEGPRPPLHAALGLVNSEIAMGLLEAGADPNCRSRNGATALMVAAGRGHIDMVRWLLERGLDPQACALDLSTALSRAAASGEVEVADLLLRGGADPNPVRGGWSPLMRASQKGHLAMVKMLLIEGADPNVVNNQGGTALTIARQKRKAGIVKLLSRVTKVDIPGERGRTPLFRACIKGDLSVIESLLAAGADPKREDNEGASAETAAALRPDVAERLGVAHTPLVVDVLDLGDDPFSSLRRGESDQLDVEARSWRGDTALHIAVLLGAPDLVDAALGQGADVSAENAVGETPWSLCIHSAPALVPRLIKAGAKIDVEKQVLVGTRVEEFCAAVRAGNLREVSERVADRSVNPHLLGKSRTPIGLAVLYGDQAMLEMLIGMGCDPQIWAFGSSTLCLAAGRGTADILHTLLKSGVSPSAEALQEAALFGRTQAMHILLDAGAAPDIDLQVLDTSALQVVVDVAMKHGLEALVNRATEVLIARPK